MPDWFFFIDDIEQVCSNYCLQWWEVVGIWLTGIATISVVIVSLMLSKRGRPRLSVSVGIRIIIGGEATDEPIEDHPKYLAVAIRNIGHRPVKVEGIGWHKLFPFNQHAYQTIPPQLDGATLPFTLDEGDSRTFYLALEDPEVEWLPEFTKHFVGRWPRIGLRFLRVTTWTPTGITFKGRLEESLYDLLIEEAEKLNAGN